MSQSEFRVVVSICLGVLCLTVLGGVLWIGSNVSNIRTSACIVAAWRTNSTFYQRPGNFLRKNNDVCTRLVKVPLNK